MSQEERWGLRFFEDEELDANDGEPPALLIERVGSWVESETKETFEAVRCGIDHTRQLNIWDEDLYPFPDQMSFWFLEVGQLTALSVVQPEEWSQGPRTETHSWPAQVCAARAAVCALKTMAQTERDVAGDSKQLGEAIAAVFVGG